MSGRLEKKERRRKEREAREAQQRQALAREQRARRLRLTATAAIGLLAVTGVVALAATAGTGEGKRPESSEAAFGPHYGGLEQRRRAADVSTMGAPSAATHTHTKLSVWVDGDRVRVPSNIGIDPRRPAAEMASLHTHSDDGKLHNEGQADATLGQFFAVWGVPFGEDRLGPYRAGRAKTVQLWVDGRPSQAFGDLRLTDKQDIQVTFGPARDAPPKAAG